MEVLGNFLMISSRARGWLTVCAAAASVALLTSCTSTDGAGDAGSSSPESSRRPKPSEAATPEGPSDDKLTEQAQAALAAVHSGTMVEAGAERVADGVHAEPLLDDDKAYRFQLVCVGSGSVQVVFKPASAGQKATVPCDGAVAQRLTVSEPLRIDVDGGKGSTGMIAWQIDTV